MAHCLNLSLPSPEAAAFSIQSVWLFIFASLIGWPIDWREPHTNKWWVSVSRIVSANVDSTPDGVSAVVEIMWWNRVELMTIPSIWADRAVFRGDSA
jgi:hypothetical protein